MLRYDIGLGGHVVKLAKAPVVEDGRADRRRAAGDYRATPMA